MTVVQFESVVDQELLRIRSEMLPELWDAGAEKMFRTAIERALDGMGIPEGPIPEERRAELDERITDETTAFF